MKTTHLRGASRLAWMLLLMLTSVCAYAQKTVYGTVLDKSTKEPVVGAAVIQSGTANGTVTDIDGNFSLKVDNLPQSIDITFLGYEKLTLNAEVLNLGAIYMVVDSKTLDDVIVKSSIAVARKTPVALSSVSPELIEEKLGNQEFPEILKSTPGVYATKAGGGYGDSQINMRGFKSANIAVMVNGVPMNDMEWGGVYWSNWTGLSDVTRSMQTQRGLGATKLSAPSVGGSINVVTKGIESKKGGAVSYSVGNDGYQKILATVSSGMNTRGWAFTVLLAKTWGDGYVQGTEFEGYNWFASIAKRLNDDHQLTLTAFGAPQWHNQRSAYDGLTIVGWQKVKDYMKGESEYRYNPTYGFGLNGERKTSSRNVYHKPQISLNHQWQISDSQSLSSVIYVSIGRGYGFSGMGTSSDYKNKWYGSSNGSLNTAFRHEDGTFAYDEIQKINAASDHGSEMVMSVSKNYHNWVGFVSNYENQINDDLTVTGGIDFRWYKGVHTNEINDLYNGEYYTDNYYRNNVKAYNNAKANDPGFVYEKLHVGDVVYRDYDGFTVQEGLFAQAEYTLNQINFFVSGSVSNTCYWRYDRFYYDDSHAESDKLNFWGFTVKGGANYNINDNNNVFFNAGYISRAPFFSGGAFLSSTVSNETNPDAVNEKVASFEVGYGFNSRPFLAKVNAYLTKWMDKTSSKRGDITKENGEQDTWFFNMEGLDARHMGVEVELTAKPAKWVDLSAMFSFGDWVWDCSPVGYFYDSAGNPIKDKKGNIASAGKAEDHAYMKLELDKVKVGGSAQTTAAIGVKFRPMDGLRIGADYNLFARNYADWDFSSNDIDFNGLKVYSSPWRIPSSYTFDVDASYSFKIGDKLNARLSGKVNNLFDQEYIQQATDGDKHDWTTAYKVFYGFGRTYSLGLKLSF